MTTQALRQTAARVAMARRFGPIAQRRKVPIAQPPTLIEADYAHRLVGVVDQLRQVVRHELSTWAWMRRADDDQGAEGRRRIRRAREVVHDDVKERRLEHVAEDFGKRTAAHHRQQLTRQAEAALGTDVVVLDGGVPDLIRGFIHENVSLIKKLEGGALAEIEAIITRATAGGARAEAVQREIEDRLGISERHARLIARDQIGKLNSRITQSRHQELGLSAYIWLTMQDPKVRPLHKPRHGTRIRYDQPPADGHAGHAIMCRCQQQPDFQDIYAELDALGV